MRTYDPSSTYDIVTLDQLNAEPWQVELLSFNPDYVSWGPHEDYMLKEGSGWDSRQIFDTWSDLDLGA